MKTSTFAAFRRISERINARSHPTRKKLTVEVMSDLLCDAAGFTLGMTVFHTYRCTCIIQALMSFVANNPPSVATNLFRTDQLSRVNTHQVFDTDVKTRKSRNWQYVYATINYFIDDLGPGGYNAKDKLFMITSQKSNAVVTGEVMSLYNTDEPGNKMGLVIAYWIAKLYSVSIYRADPMDLPEPFPQAYKNFLDWKGKSWDLKVPLLRFQEDDFWKKDEMSSCFPFAHEYIPGEECYIEMEIASEWAEDKFFMTLCDKLGLDQLSKYCTTFWGSLLDFYLDMKKLKPEPNIVSCKIAQICRVLMLQEIESSSKEAVREITKVDLKEDMMEIANQNSKGRLQTNQ